ncbi:MAG: Thioredoxin [Candidatus Magasanikbacteria bacterium GW2011_GWA2_45_39]|uniref:Thioredoxin n=1 Tax=Candidatus Magasanikbacteria bacterium GW2011_GWA2_45_39 TaxID=1619041 RepID=A0A0G1PPT4_9BACT|nr:MAG: Thioredoxin [Candidatus Magasanikbacteria bacterium GW2011_GWA2_45_39]HBW73822.1 thioredoxin [Candidatus Magasanikbacteria bacterium]
MELILNEQTFAKEVLQSAEPVMVDFWATWCGPCKTMLPVVEDLAKELSGKPYKIGKVNVDENSALAGQFNVMSIPTFIFFKGGKEQTRLMGVQSKDKLLKTLEDLK